MTIQTLKHQYYILQQVRETEQLEQFLCEEAESGSGQLYDIFRFCQRELVVRLIVVFMDQTKNRAFEDFRECFSKDGELYLVFTHSKEISLVEKLEQELCVLKERIAIGKNILERILLLDMPDMLVYDVLKGDRIRVAASLDISFWYSMEQVEKMEEITIRNIQSRLAEVFCILFQREIQMEASTDILDFVENLRNGIYQSYMEIYQGYAQLTERLSREGLVIKPNTFWFRVWEKIKAGYKKVKPVLVMMLVLVLAAYLLYSILHPAKTTEEVFNFQKIGTLSTVETTAISELESFDIAPE